MEDLPLVVIPVKMGISFRLDPRVKPEDDAIWQIWGDTFGKSVPGRSFWKTVDNTFGRYFIGDIEVLFSVVIPMKVKFPALPLHPPKNRHPRT